MVQLLLATRYVQLYVADFVHWQEQTIARRKLRVQVSITAVFYLFGLLFFSGIEVWKAWVDQECNGKEKGVCIVLLVECEWNKAKRYSTFISR